MKQNLLVGQSGGPTSVINGSLYGIVKEGQSAPDEISKVYGMINGLEGYLSGKYLNFGNLSADELELVRTTPGSYLGSCRYKLPEDPEDPVYARAFDIFEQKNIGYVLYIGGNDSMDTVSKLARYAEITGSDIRFIGVPKTIDNDLVQTDHTPGFGSAAKYVATTVREIAADASVYDNKPSVTIVEIMGRDAGWLTASSMLARKFYGDNPILIYLPEVSFDPEAFLNTVTERLTDTKNLVVCISEGIHDESGKLICEYDNNVGMDAFGHKMLAGSGKYLENLVRNRLGIKARSVELNVCQRCSSAHLSRTDLTEAVQSGRFGVRAALLGRTKIMVNFHRDNDQPYAISYGTTDVEEVCNQVKTVPRKWITGDGCDIDDAFLTYARPLIQGHVEVPQEDGLPKFAYRK